MFFIYITKANFNTLTNQAVYDAQVNVSANNHNNIINIVYGYSGGRVKYPDRHIIQTYIIVALDSIDKSLISHDLCFPMEKRLETLFDCLQVLLTDLKETLTDRTPKVIIVYENHNINLPFFV